MRAWVHRSTGSWYKVQTEDGRFLEARLAGRLRTEGSRSTNPVAVGDWVELEMSGDEALIIGVEDRKNHLVRRSVNLSKKTQVIAANLDQCVLLATLAEPRTLIGFMDRFLLTSEAFAIPPVVVFNKCDLYGPEQEDELEYLRLAYQQAGYPVLVTSAVTGQGLDELRAQLKDKVSLIFGNSGVGKSTLVNAIQPGLELKTQELSETHRQGKHTTTFAELFLLDEGGALVDTPGVRSFGLVDMEPEEVGDYFPEIFRLKQNCRFHNCLHLDEPGCAVKQALEENKLAPTRYRSYVNVMNGVEEDSPYRQNIYKK